MIAGWQAGPREAVASNGVDVWRSDLEKLLAIADAAKLSSEERRRAATMAPRVRTRWIAARLALRQVLGRYLDQDPERIALRTGEHGKPELSDRSAELRFNLSHSGRLALVAVTGELEVGVDVEEMRDRRDFSRLAELGLDPATARAVRDAPPPSRAAIFYAGWVRREAIAKCLGVGLFAPLPPQPASAAPLLIDPGHAASVAIAAPTPPEARHFHLDWP